MLSNEACNESYCYKRSNTLIYRYSEAKYLFDVRADAVPQDVLGVDGANEELEHKLPMAHTEQDAVDSVQDSNCSIKLVVVVCEIQDCQDIISKCRSAKAGAENDQMSLWVFDLFSAHISEGFSVYEVKYCG